jgi:penicillin-binding protein 2
MIISLGIGQGEILLTPLQLANVAAILANIGYYYTPHLIKSINGTGFLDANWITKFKSKHTTTIDPAHFETVIEGMSQVTKPGGTAVGTGVGDIEICAKTGTAQNPHGKDHSLYIAFSPRVNPKIAIAVIVENGGFGATWAAPIANLLIEKYLKPTAEPFNVAMRKRMLEGVISQ